MPTTDRPNKNEAKPTAKHADLRIPPWVLLLPLSLFRRIERLARRRGLSEEEVTQQAIELAEKEKRTKASADPTEATIPIKGLGNVPVSQAKEIAAAIGRFFGGQTKLTKAQRKARATTANLARKAKKIAADAEGKKK